MKKHRARSQWIMASPEDARSAAADWTNQYLDCRIYGHDWRGAGQVHQEGRYLILEEPCRSCGVQRESRIDAFTGMLDGSPKITGYPDGYLLVGKGRVGREARGAIRLERLNRVYKLPRLKAVKRSA